MKALKFVCTHCGHDKMEEKLVNVTVFHEITVDRHGNYVEVKPPVINDGDLIGYDCEVCEEPICDDDGDLITNLKELADWLAEQSYNPAPELFCCPDCKSSLLREIMSGPDMWSSSIVTSITSEGVKTSPYGTITGGQVEEYTCGTCGYTPKGPDGRPINTPEDLVKWIAEAK